ncbi:MAG: [FeFe] hydrogenase H-cluster radical SAM maturase HydE [Firmicutes bacterium]|nr:[FeFe] hydrogenase H-cluster radical SAM maturase HydE [Bacillota bacterium]
MKQNIQKVIDKAVRKHELTREEIIVLLSCEFFHKNSLFVAANRVREKYLGDAVHLRGLIEFSNYCRRNCSYCGLQCANKKLKRYRMSMKEIYQAALGAYALGYRTIVLQSGEDFYYDADKIADLVRRIKKLGLAVTLSCGVRSFEEYRLWREAGADRYLLKHETADPALYQTLHPDSSFSERLEALIHLRRLGYQVGSGCIVGLPGQTLESLADDLLFLKALDVEMAGIGPFIPHPDTPLMSFPQGSAEMVLKMVAVLRLLLPLAHLPATTALATVGNDFRAQALRCGANVIMPNVTPRKYRQLYAIYPHKAGVKDTPVKSRQQIVEMITALGRKIATDQGHSPKEKFCQAVS